ncbi:uncharacterized protein LOC111627438, partial [Centruroides sculpturatus]|uniref:uncharacterized protein LOC111627438 n=1 Tax=Centruroides sculpturatus TaxID=218467 RepID=UPI000C6F00F5
MSLIIKLFTFLVLFKLMEFSSNEEGECENTIKEMEEFCKPCVAEYACSHMDEMKNDIRNDLEKQRNKSKDIRLEDVKSSVAKNVIKKVNTYKNEECEKRQNEKLKKNIENGVCKSFTKCLTKSKVQRGSVLNLIANNTVLPHEDETIADAVERNL